MLNRRQYFFALAACLWGIVLSSSISSQTCTHLNDLAFYSKGGYTVREVRLESPIDFLHAISSQLNALKPQLSVQPGDVFKLDAFTDGKDLINKALDDAEKNQDPRSRIRVVLAKIANCGESAPPFQLDVVYRVFTTNYNAYLTHTWEFKSNELERPATTAATSQANGFVTLQPFVNYNHTRGLYSGVMVRLKLPGIFDNVEISGSGSTNSNVQDFQLSGTRTPRKTVWQRVDYRIAYTHSDVPAGSNRLREGTMLAQAFGATRPLGSKGVILRSGFSFEGGNQQTDIVNAAATRSLVDSGYGGLKTYLGATLRTKSYSLAGSYGLQLGTDGTTGHVDFIKNLVDVGFNGRWVPQHEKAGDVHKVLALETQFTAGFINVRTAVPVVQRFFGGNVSHEFIEGDTWLIRSQPFIRSIPENRLSALDVGGTKFFSANVTVAKAFWGRAIIPKEIATDPDFFPALEASKVSARNILVGVYLSKINVFGDILTHLDPVEADLTKLRTMLDSLPAEFPASLPEDQREALDDSRGLVSDATKIIQAMFQDRKTLPSKLKSLLKEQNSATCMDDDSCSQLTTLRFNLADFQTQLAGAGFTEAAAVGKAVKESLDRQQPALVRELDAIDITEAERLADADMKLVNATLDSFTKELNWFAVSPVAAFDAARVWPDKRGVRYGIGSGVRLSLVNFNVTVGYSFNPRRNPGEGRGAMFVTMDVTDVFR